MLFSSTTLGFYHPAIHGPSVPKDAVEITDDTYKNLLAGQAAGQVIQSGADGRPLLADPAASYETWNAVSESYDTDETARVADISAAVRAERDRLLAECDWTQLEDAPLDETAARAWAEYRQTLRDVPQQAGFPSLIEWPEQPE